MDMNKAFYLRKEDRTPHWVLIDAQNMVLGRMATRIADILRGKDKAYFSPHTDCGDYVVVINAEKVLLTGNKWEGKTYERYTGWRGNRKTTTAADQLRKHPTSLVELAVKRMLPKNTLNRDIFKKLKVYAGAAHPHQAQQVKTITL